MRAIPQERSRSWRQSSALIRFRCPRRLLQWLWPITCSSARGMRYIGASNAYRASPVSSGLMSRWRAPMPSWDNLRTREPQPRRPLLIGKPLLECGVVVDPADAVALLQRSLGFVLSSECDDVGAVLLGHIFIVESALDAADLLVLELLPAFERHLAVD